MVLAVPTPLLDGGGIAQRAWMGRATLITHQPEAALLPSSRVTVHLFLTSLSPACIHSCPVGPTDSGAST